MLSQQIAQAVAQHRGGDGPRQHPADPEIVSGRHHRASDNQRLPRRRNADSFHQNRQEDRRVAVAGEHRFSLGDSVLQVPRKAVIKGPVRFGRMRISG